ncbi:MAG TPA: cytochrome c oxidase subunit 3 [Verrucomicrobiae bacterium]|jgi:cytochrome c oxidase subunit 3|nr:cytochrome c oxidase subunit 3 [Verrucomicrobiae bacterium]
MEIPYTTEIRRDTGLYNAKVGIWLFLASEVMLFGALFSSYILLRVGAPEGFWPHGWLTVWLGTLNTIVLITSSITTVMAWASLKMGNFGKFKMFHAITLCCALAFLCIKSYEYHDKFIHNEITLKDGRIADGHVVKKTEEAVTIEGRFVKDRKDLFNLSTPFLGPPKYEEIEIKTADIATMSNYGPAHHTYNAIYFTLTGLHALHVIGGALVIFYLWAFGGKMWKTDPERFTNRVEISGLFWHFVDLVWIFLFPVLYLL